MIDRELVREINKYFQDKGFKWLSVNATTVEDGCTVLMSDIHNGDWKHDHIAIDHFVAEFFKNHPTLDIVKTWREGYEGSDGDWYSETHLWKIGPKKKKDEMPVTLTLYEAGKTYSNEDRRCAQDFLEDEIEIICARLKKDGYEFPDGIMADGWDDYALGVKYGVDEVIESAEVLIDILKRFDAKKFETEINILKHRINQWLRVHGYEDEFDEELCMEKLSQDKLREYADKMKKETLEEGALLEWDMPFFGKKARAERKENKKIELQKKIIAEFKNPAKSSEHYFYIEGKNDGKPMTWKDAMKAGLTEEEIVNAIVVTKNGIYVRRGTEYVEGNKRYSSNSAVVADDNQYIDPKEITNNREKAKEDDKKAKQLSKDISKLPKHYQDWIFAKQVETGDTKPDGTPIMEYKMFKYHDFIKKVPEDERKDYFVTDAKGSVRVAYESAVEALKKSQEAEEGRIKKSDDDEQARIDKQDREADADALRTGAKAASSDELSLEKSVFRFFDGDKLEADAAPLTWKEFKKLPAKYKQGYRLEYKDGDETKYMPYDEMRRRFSKLHASYQRDTVDAMLNESYARSRADMEYDDDISPISRDMKYQGFDRIDDDFC